MQLPGTSLTLWVAGCSKPAHLSKASPFRSVLHLPSPGPWRTRTVFIIASPIQYRYGARGGAKNFFDETRGCNRALFVVSALFSTNVSVYTPPRGWGCSRGILTIQGVRRGHDPSRCRFHHERSNSILTEIEEGATTFPITSTHTVPNH